MKEDLDRLMEERGLDAAVVAGAVHGNPAMYYMTAGAGLTSGYVVKKRGAEPLLLCSPMEREEAAASGLETVNLARYDFLALLREHEDRLAATVELYRRIFADLEVSGRVGFYGLADRGSAWMLLNALNAGLEGIEVCGEFDVSLIDAARATKGRAEVERIREVGRRTCTVVAATLDYLRSHAVRDGVLVEDGGTPLTIGRVHQEINQLLAAQRLEDPEGFIFAIGRDAGIPHSKGTADAPLALGQTIVFDIFPREAGGGYFFDLTRTFCLGYAPPEAERVYRDVYDCWARLMDAFRGGEETRTYQQMACELFANRGHPTIAEDSKTEVGYVHTVGHGLGLVIHEEPFFADVPSNRSVLEPGHVFTCEPGLYYPEPGMGVRIEDVVWIDDEGVAHNLTDFSKELVVEM